MRLGNSYQNLLNKTEGVINYYFNSQRRNVERYIIESDGLFYCFKIDAHGHNTFLFNVYMIPEAKQRSYRILTDSGVLFEVSDDKFLEEVESLEYNFNTNMLNKN